MSKPKLSKEVHIHYEYMLERLEAVHYYLSTGNPHMASAKLLADISRIKGVLGIEE